MKINKLNMTNIVGDVSPLLKGKTQFITQDGYDHEHLK